ncbi:MAG: M48 family metalloprotease [Acaryochloridaceae cyanobacterium RL_2_7]|nr:M48 family metalloprotease [Acaryochloridaceae cyanobacterium RL_2_7]
MSGQMFSKSRQKSTVISLLAAGFVIGTTAPAVHAISWRDLFLRSVQVIQLSNISTRQEIALGDQIHKNLQTQGMKLSRNRRLSNYVDQIGDRLVRNAQRTQIPYKFHVVDDKAINAYATAGGYVYVTTGLMQAADNEAQLASVVAHEISHIEEKHLIEQIRQQTITRGLVATALGSDRNVLANIGTELIFNRPQSRKDEYEADATGLDILRKSNYSTPAMPAFMRKLLGGGRTPTFLSTHPAVPDRITELEALIRSGPTNDCDTANIPEYCGTNKDAYNRAVKAQL